MARGGIDPFATLKVSDISDEPSEAIPQILRRRPSRAKRTRTWEQRNKVTGYRGIPPELNEKVKAIARQFSVPTGEVARAFLEHGLKAYEQGELSLTPSFLVGKMTLYPTKNE